ncbi:hypothetical protein ACJ41O_007355 [Fusarium nematophilum]
MAPHCVERYIVHVEVAVMEAVFEKYKALVGGGYDKKFQLPQGYNSGQVPDQIEAFMISSKADHYFECTETKCMANFKSRSSVGRSQGATHRRPTNLANVTFTLQDPEGFWKDIGEEYGMDKSWVKFGSQRIKTTKGC